MRWTSKRPEQPGWYWWRDRAEDQGPEVMHVVFEDIEESNGFMQPSLVAMNEIDCEEVRFMSGEWAGPIPYPEESVP